MENQTRRCSSHNKNLPVGTEIYYGGDMANDSGFGKVVAAATTRWGDQMDIEMEDGRLIRGLAPCAFSAEYLGHGGTRFVTKEAYQAWHQKAVDAFYARFNQDNAA